MRQMRKNVFVKTGLLHHIPLSSLIKMTKNCTPLSKKKNFYVVWPYINAPFVTGGNKNTYTGILRRRSPKDFNSNKQQQKSY